MADPVASRVEALLTKNHEVPPEKLRPEADLRHDLGLDSFAAVELSFAIEEEFSIKVAEDEMAQVKTLGDLIEAVRRRVQATPAQQGASPGPATP